MASTFSQSYQDAVRDARSPDALQRLAALPGDVGRLVRKLAEYNHGKHDEYRTDALHILLLGRLTLVEDLPCFGEPPETWRASYEPYRAALSEIEASDAAFRALWQRACGKMFADPADDEEARALVERIQAQRDAVTRPVGELQRLRVQLLPDAVSSWLAAIQDDDAKLPALQKKADEALRKAEEARNALDVIQRHRDMARGQMQAIAQEMLGEVEHADKHDELRKLLVGKPTAVQPAIKGASIWDRPLEDGEYVNHVESPW